MVSRLTTLLAPLALATLLGGCGAPGAGGAAGKTSSNSSASDPSTSYAPPMPSGAAAPDCDSDSVQNMLGQAYSDGAGEAARKKSGSRIIRLLKPGQVMTMEYDPTRINIILDDKGAIQALRCG
jgi:hypothetical protein